MPGKKAESFVDDSRGMWKNLDDSFFRTIKFVKGAYISTTVISYILVGLGVMLFAISFYPAFAGQEVAPFGYITGGMSMATVVTIFFKNQQDTVTKTAAKALGNLAQIQMIYKLYSLKFAELADSAKEDEAFLRKALLLEKSTKMYVNLVQDVIENDCLQQERKSRSEKIARAKRKGMKAPVPKP